MDDVLFLVNLLAAMTWTGGMVAVTVATIAARHTLPPEQQVRFFRALGRRYGIASGVALALFAATGVGLAGEPSEWTGTETAVAALTAVVAGLTVLGVLNARAVQRLRGQALERPDDAELAGRHRAAARTATALRALIAAVTLLTVGVATL